MSREPISTLEVLEQEIIACHRCPRLVKHRAGVARVRRRAYLDWDYWGKPVPGFGDPNARLLIVGLAPAAHGANRTGRMFTGDRSGDFLYRALHHAGFASQPTSVCRGDGLHLTDAYVTAVVRCAPPDNKPAPNEIENCRPFLERELGFLASVRLVVALGRVAFDGYLTVLQKRGLIHRRSAFRFGHDRVNITGEGQPLLVSSYHPSQQNTSTGRLTDEMLKNVFLRVRRLLEGEELK